MKMHTDDLTADDLRICAGIARRDYNQDIYVDDVCAHGSQSRHHRIDFHAGSLNGRYARNSGHNGGNTYNRAASWTAWGYLIAILFNNDPNAIIGGYKGATDFRHQIEQTTGKTEADKRFLSVLQH